MRAAVLRGGEVETRETADPVPGEGQILVRTLACAICASDLHFMDHPDADADDEPDADLPLGEDLDEDDVAAAERIDESESEAAPAAID